MRSNILSLVICLFIIMFGVFQVVDAESFSRGELLKNITGVSRLQCIHRCKRHLNCSDAATSKDGTCLLLKKKSGDAVKSDVWKVDRGQLKEVKRISPVQFPNLSAAKHSQETHKPAPGKNIVLYSRV